MGALEELEQAYERYKNDPAFQQELGELLAQYANRPSRLYYAKNMTEDLGGAKIYMKREDLNHTAPIKSTTCLARRCSLKRWGRPG